MPFLFVEDTHLSPEPWTPVLREQWPLQLDHTGFCCPLYPLPCPLMWQGPLDLIHPLFPGLSVARKLYLESRAYWASGVGGMASCQPSPSRVPPASILKGFLAHPALLPRSWFEWF